jgi:hypothetical protein
MQRMVTQPQASDASHADEGRRALMDSVRGLPLGSHFSRATLKAAEALAMHAPGWRRPLAWFQPTGSRADALQCEMTEPLGNQRLVTVHLYLLFGQLALESECSCGQPLCQHAAALLLRLQQLLDWPRAMTPLQRWQQSLAAVRPSVAATPPIDSRELRQLVCLLDVDRTLQPVGLTARLLLVHGSDGLQQPHRWLAAEHARAHAHLSRQALIWQAQLAIGQRRPRPQQPGYLLQGHAGASLLDELLDAGICHHAQTLQIITAAELRPAPWQWTHDEHAQARLELQWPPGHVVQLIDVDGLRYLDETRGELGRLALPHATWSMLQHLPPIPPDDSSLAACWPRSRRRPRHRRCAGSTHPCMACW